ncbi:hypothetical protein ACFL04_01565 [Patescibacteria group bacterium]
MTNQKGLTNLLAIGLILGVTVVLLSAVIVYQQNVDEQKQVEENINSLPETANTQPVNTNISRTDTNTTVNTNTAVTLTGSTTESIDDTWNRYTNNDLGFYLNIPKQAWFGYAGCEWQTDSYRPTGGMLPVKTFEGDDSVIIAQESLYELSGETEEADGTHNFSECNLVNNSYERLSSDPPQTWHFKTATVTNDSELNDFVDTNFGTGVCNVDSQTESDLQAGVFDVAINSGGPDSGCFLNYAFVVKYYPDGNIAVTWDLGQASSFATEDFEPLDPEMTNSFRFIE